MSFDNDNQMAAWTTFKTNGAFKDGCVVTDEYGRNIVVFVVERTIAGVVTKCIEYIKNLRDIKQWQYLDSAIRVFMYGGTGYVGGLEHLNKQEVSYLIDNEYQGTAVVQDGGFTIDIPAQYVDVGLSYEMRVTTFPQAPIDSSISLAAKKRFSKVGIRGIFSKPPIIQGQRPPDRSPGSVMNSPEPEKYFYNSAVIDGGSDEFAVVTITEPLPLRMTVSAIFGKIESNQL